MINHKCRLRKSTFCVSFSSKSKANIVFPKYILKPKARDKSIQERKKLYCHVTVKNYLCNFLCKFFLCWSLFIKKLYCFNGSLLHGPKDSRSKLHDVVRLQGPSHRSRFLFLSRHLSSWTELRPAFENLTRIPLMNKLSFYIGYFRWFEMVLGRFRSFLDRFRSF